MGISTQKRFTWISLTLLLVCYLWFGWYLCGLRSKPIWLNSACYRVFGAPIPVMSADERSGRQPQWETNLTPRSSPAIAPSPHASPLATPLPDPAPSPPPAHDSEATVPPAADPASPMLEPNGLEPHSAEPEGGRPDALAFPADATHYSRSFCGAVFKYNLPAGLLAIAWILLSSMAFMAPLTSFSAFIKRWFHSDTVAFATVFLVAAMAAVILYWLHVFLQVITILAVDTLARIDIQYWDLSEIQAFWVLTLTALTGLVLGWTANAIL